MNALKTIAIALSCTLFASCMDTGYDKPDLNEPPYGNNDITETNVISIADLKAMYGTTISSNMMEQITDDIKIKGIVTGNDIQGNIYNEVSIDDGTAAFIICIAQGGLSGYLPVGQEILVSLKDLYIGAYGQQGEIGTPYTNASGRTYVSRMSRMLWNQHFKLIDVFTATENIVLGLEGESGLDLKKAAARVREICDEYGFEVHPDQKVYDMTVSQKQTLEIVKALYRGADILILDEPTAVLTPQETQKLFAVIRNMRKAGKTVIIITHKLQEVLELSDRVVILRKGEYIASVPTSEATEQSLT